MALITCTECGKEFSDKAVACPNCGCPTSEVIKCINDDMQIILVEEISCPYCGEPINMDDDYCDNCGTRLTPYHKNTKVFTPTPPTAKQDYTTCPDCGFHNDIGVFKCQNCGHKYTVDEYANSAVVAPNISLIKCPNCNGTHIEISLLPEATKTTGKAEVRKKSLATRAVNSTGRATMNLVTGGLWGVFAPKQSKYSEAKREISKITYKKYSICQECGFSWETK